MIKPPLKLSFGEIAVIVFTLFYMSLWLATSIVRQNVEFVYYFIVMCVLIGVVWLLHMKVRFHIAALWGLSLWGLAHMAGGLMPIPESWPIRGETHVLYNWWIIPGLVKYDHLVHAGGFALMTWICWQGLKKAFANSGMRVKPTLGLMTLCVAAGMGFGAANEVVEFIATLTLPNTNVGGYENTGWDLVSNFVGSVIAAGMIWIRYSFHDDK